MHPSNFSQLLWPGLRQIYGDAYAQLPEEYSRVFNVDSSTKNYEKDINMTTLGLIPAKGIGDPIAYDTAYQGWTTTYTHSLYGGGFFITREAYEDSQYRNIRNLPGALARSVRHTIEIVAQNTLNNAFDTTNYATGGDGKALLTTDHPLITGGSFANELTVSADLDITSLEQAIIDIGNFTDDRGLLIAAKPKLLIIPPELEWSARRLLKSVQLPDSNQNDINPAQNIMPYYVMSWLTDTDAWFIQTDVPNGLNFIWRRRPEFKNDTDFDSDIAKYKTTMRFSVGWSDPRGLFGSPGA